MTITGLYPWQPHTDRCLYLELSENCRIVAYMNDACMRPRILFSHLAG